MLYEYFNNDVKKMFQLLLKFYSDSIKGAVKDVDLVCGSEYPKLDIAKWRMQRDILIYAKMINEILMKGNIITGFQGRQEKRTPARRARELANKLTHKLSMIKRNPKKDGDGTPKQKRSRFGKKESSIESNNSLSKDEMKKPAEKLDTDTQNKIDKEVKTVQNSEKNFNKDENSHKQTHKQDTNLNDTAQKDQNEKNSHQQTITLDLPDILEDITVKPYETVEKS